jgi:hypothetical protein
MFGLFQTSGSGGSSSGGSTSGGSSGGTSSGGTSGGGSTGSTGGTTTTALRGTLSGTVARAGLLKLSFQGRAVSRLKAGRYRVTVVDRTPARSFVVQGSKRSAITVSGVSFVGTHSVIVDFKAGQWSFFTSAGTKSKSSFVVVA